MNKEARTSTFLNPKLCFNDQGYVKDRLFHPFRVIENFKNLNKPERKEFVKKAACQLVSDPEYCDLFFSIIENHHRQNPEDRVAIGELKGCLFSGYLENAAMAQDTFLLTEEQLLGFARMSLGDNPLLIEETDDEADSQLKRDRKKATEAIMRGFVHGTTSSKIKGMSEKEIREQFIKDKPISDEFVEAIAETQDRTVELFYRLTNAILPTGDQKLYKLLFNLLTFQTPILKETDYQTALYVLAKLAINDDSLAKMQIVDHVIELFSKILPDVIKKDSIYFENIMMLFPFHKEYTDILNRDKNRAEGLIRVYQEIRETIIQQGGIYALITADDAETVIKEYGAPFSLDYPDNLFVKTNPLWFLYARLASEYLVDKEEINSPVCTVAFPDNTIRSINIAKGNGDNFTAARILMKYVISQPLIKGHEDHFFPMSVLEYLRPQLTSEQKKQIGISLETIKTSLKTPSRGIPEEGVVFVMNEHKKQEIEACNIFFDQSGRKVRLTVGNYDFNFLLDNQLNLCYPDGELLDLTEESKLWWGNLILSNLEAFTSYNKEEDIILSNLVEESIIDAVELTRKQLLKRRGHLRREPPNRGYTEGQRNKVFELRWPLPGIESLDLKTFNEGQDLTKFDGQYTYVLPLERERRSEPLRLKAPYAFKKILESIG